MRKLKVSHSIPLGADRAGWQAKSAIVIAGSRLHFQICSTLWNRHNRRNIERQGMEPAPQRIKKTTWKEFLAQLRFTHRFVCLLLRSLKAAGSAL